MSKVTYNRGERQKPTTPDYRKNYDQIDWSKKSDPADDDKTEPTKFVVEGEISVYFDNPDIYSAVVAGDAALQECLKDDDETEGPSSMWDDVRNRLAFTDGYL